MVVQNVETRRFVPLKLTILTDT